jgi:hypothetical protein
MAGGTLDGNAAAGALQRIFRTEMTSAHGRCDSCQAVAPIGQAALYARAPGMVLRCTGCGEVLLRVVEAPDDIWLDLRGISALRFAVIHESSR